MHDDPTAGPAPAPGAPAGPGTPQPAAAAATPAPEPGPVPGPVPGPDAGRRAGSEWVFGGVYGTVLSSALLAALQNSGEYTPFYDAAWVLVTVGAAGLVHGYAHHMSTHAAAYPDAPGGHRWRQLGRALLDEWPMVVAALPTVVLLFLAGLGDWAEPAVTATGLGLNTGLLFAWGAFAALRTGYRLASALVIGVADAAIGLAIVVANAVIK
ncbi:hypothetical protein [Streptomyces sp. NPDC089919]|uniref:hypothetical protein n=1 Tax=Streptomyces sp. NPDC089919 TaxID=3155188 RepID=UPI00343E5741